MNEAGAATVGLLWLVGTLVCAYVITAVVTTRRPSFQLVLWMVIILLFVLLPIIVYLISLDLG